MMMKTTENGEEAFTLTALAPNTSSQVTATLLQHIHLESPQSCDAMNVARTDIKQKTHWWLLRPGVGLEDRK